MIKLLAHTLRGILNQYQCEETDRMVDGPFQILFGRKENKKIKIPNPNSK